MVFQTICLLVSACHIYAHALKEGMYIRHSDPTERIKNGTSTSMVVKPLGAQDFESQYNRIYEHLESVTLSKYMSSSTILWCAIRENRYYDVRYM